MYAHEFDSPDFQHLGTNLHTISDLVSRLINEAPVKHHDLLWSIKTLADATAAEIDKMPGGFEWPTGKESRPESLS